MNVIGARLEQQFPEFNAKWGVTVVPLRTQFSGEIRKPLLILLGAGGIRFADRLCECRQPSAGPCSFTQKRDRFARRPRSQSLADRAATID
jgi:hypothetical protein